MPQSGAVDRQRPCYSPLPPHPGQCSHERKGTTGARPDLEVAMQRFTAVAAITAVFALAACDNHGTTSITATPDAGTTRASAPATAAAPQVIVSGLEYP